MKDPTLEIFRFTLYLSEDSGTMESIDAKIYDKCDDCIVASVDGVVHIEFDRESESSSEAVKSAISDVLSVEGIRVTRVELEGTSVIDEINHQLAEA